MTKGVSLFIDMLNEIITRNTSLTLWLDCPSSLVDFSVCYLFTSILHHLVVAQYHL
jgi:hypothetical protein